VAVEAAKIQQSIRIGELSQGRLNSILDTAISYRRRGFSVIPIKPKDKKPLIQWERYQTEAPSEEQIREWFSQWSDANLGLVTGAISDCIVVDLDSEEAKEKLKSVIGDYDLATVPRSRTGKGWQLFFKHPEVSIPNRAGVLPNMDVRADGGYVVAPPSIHPNGRAYKWEVSLNGQLPKLPLELFRLIQAPTAHNEQSYGERFDTSKALAGVPEGQRDENCFRLACKLRNADVPREMAETLVLEAARNCEPPFLERIALDKVAWVYQRYEPKQRNEPNRPEFHLQFLSMKELLALPPDPTRWIWGQTLPAAGASVVVSKPKIGKSTFAANLAIAIARGLPFLGRNTQQSPVAYLSLDASLPEMIETFQPFQPRPTDPIFIHAGSAPKQAVAEIMRWVTENSARFVIVDTLQRLFRFQNVNDYSEVTNAIEPLTEAAREQKIHVMFLHHAKKDAADDLDSAIGSTAIRGLAYTYLHLKRLPNSERRILRSDQRGGKNISEMAIGFDRATGWLEIQGTMEEAEIEEAEPQIVEFLKAQEGGVAEKDILRGLNIRAMIVSKALRQLFRNNHIERTGRGRKGDPFRYSMAISLDSLPEEGVIGGETPGIESPKQQKTLAYTKEILFPEHREENGKSTEENPKMDRSGRESESWEPVTR
jgi:hypothetical protein